MTIVTIVPGPAVKGIESGMSAISWDVYFTAFSVERGSSMLTAVENKSTPPAIRNAPMENPKIWKMRKPLKEKKTIIPIALLKCHVLR
jgi:hypothetical protein